jgi:hypothetical protein
MPGAGNAIDFEWFRYTEDNGTTFWSVKTDKDWGGNAQSGLAPFNAADPVWPRSTRYRLRKCVLQDPVSTRRTERVLGTAAAPAGVPGTIVVTVARGNNGAYTLSSLGCVPQKKPKAAAIFSKPEPITT